MSNDSSYSNAIDVAQSLARDLKTKGIEYALGGAIALGYWAAPRGTLDVDVTLFVAAERPSECLWLLQDIGCEMDSTAHQSLREHGFCRATFHEFRVDVFVPTIPFYEAARARRKEVRLGDESVTIWDAETLAVFKMMFFRRKDIADVEEILRSQGARFDRAWVRGQVEALYGARDPRVAQWDELVSEIPADS